MSDPNVDAWDRLCDEQDEAEAAKLAYMRLHADRITRILAAMIASGKYMGRTPQQMFKLALEMLAPLTDAGTDPYTGDWS